jgi:hypothetical protein
MALFTDGEWTTVEGLRAYESTILEVAEGQSIDLESKIELGAAEVGDELLSFLLENADQDPKAGTRRGMGLADVVVTPLVRRWVTMQALAGVFRDAYHNQLNDRFRGKWEAYERQAKAAKEHTWRQGVGLVLEPIPRASEPEVLLEAGTPMDGVLYVQVSWVNARMQEGAPSAAIALEATAGMGFAVSAGPLPAHAVAWRVYAGLSRDSLTRQIPGDLAPGAIWRPSGAVSQGPQPSDGQASEVFVTGGHRLRRG